MRTTGLFKYSLARRQGTPEKTYVLSGKGWANISGRFKVPRPEFTIDTHLRSGVPFIFFKKKRTSDRRLHCQQ